MKRNSIDEQGTAPPAQVHARRPTDTIAAAQTLVSRFRLRRCERVGDSPRVSGPVWIEGGGRVQIGDRVVIDAREAPVELFAHPGAELRLGDDVHVHPGASLEALGRVVVGDRVEIGRFCKVLDTHYHPLEGDRRNRRPPIPVIIGDDVVIGEDAVLLPGAQVESGTRIPARAVVRQRGRAKPVEPAVPVTSRRGLAWARRPLHRARQVVQVGRAWILFGRPALLKRVYCGHGVRVSNAGTLRLADGLLFLGGMLPTAVVCRTGATLDIGTGGLFAYGTTLDAAASIVIGARCLVGQRVTIRDHDGEGARPITIGDDVWLAHGAVVGPGVRIGHRVVVGAGSVVLRDVPDDHVALGNPAKAVPLGLLSRSG